MVLEGLWPADTIDRLRDIVDVQHPEFGDPARLEDYLGEKGERYLAPVKLSAEIGALGILGAPALDALCCALLGDDFVFEALGAIMVHPGARAQGVHRDGARLFPETGIDPILPVTALTIAIPLVDVDPDLAPTAIAPGSHRDFNDRESEDLQAVALNRGDIAVWDFRVSHAGLANRTDRARPAIYLTACRPFWIDHRNFVKTARAKLVVEPALMGTLGHRLARAQPGS